MKFPRSFIGHYKMRMRTLAQDTFTDFMTIIERYRVAP